MSIQSIKSKVLAILGKKEFTNSDNYWNLRYDRGGNSGKGSYGKFAEFKAKVINEFLETNDIRSVIEFGCGDGNQLTYLKYKDYTGIDINRKVIENNKKKFNNDSRKFMLLNEFKSNPLKKDVTLSLDVIYHLVEDEVFEEHMSLLFNHAEKFVIIYSSNSDMDQKQPHVRHRKFDDWIFSNTTFEFFKHIENPHNVKADASDYSHADFFIYKQA